MNQSNKGASAPKSFLCPFYDKKKYGIYKCTCPVEAPIEKSCEGRITKGCTVSPITFKTILIERKRHEHCR